MSVMTHSYGSVSSPAKKSSADANPRAPYPSEDSASTRATRNESSSSMTATKGSLDTTYQPFSVDLRGVSEARYRKSCFTSGSSETIQQYHCCRFRPLWLSGFDHLGHPDQVS